MDRTDYQILNILQADSRCTLRHIGDQVGLTPPAVSERIRRMEECGVIRSYRIDIDRTRLDCNITGFISVSRRSTPRSVSSASRALRSSATTM